MVAGTLFRVRCLTVSGIIGTTHFRQADFVKADIQRTSGPQHHSLDMHIRQVLICSFGGASRRSCCDIADDIDPLANLRLLRLQIPQQEIHVDQCASLGAPRVMVLQSEHPRRRRVRRDTTRY